MKLKLTITHVNMIGIILISVLLSIASIGFAQSGTWDTMANMPTARWALSTSAVDGKIYAFGGYSIDKTFSTLEVYDCATDTWTNKRDMPTAYMGFSTSMVNGKIYLIGGRVPAQSLPFVYEYDPITNNYIPKRYMPTPRVHLSTSAVNGKIYAIGGSQDVDGGFYSIVEVYDPATDTWTTKTPMREARNGLSTSMVNGKIYAIGGYNGFVRGISTVEEYDPATDTWTTKTPMPTPRLFLSTSVVNEKIYAIGGISNYRPLSIVEVYDPATDTWLKAKPDMPTERCAFSTSEVKGEIYSIGGAKSLSGPPWDPGLKTVEKYTPTFPTLYPYNVQFSSHFMQPGIDTLTINANICNPQNHNLMARAIFASIDSAIVDSVLLCDDGNHEDGGAGDGLFGCYIAPLLTEDEFIVTIKTVDLDTASDCVLKNAARFTTIGPVVMESSTIWSSDTFPNPGDRIDFLFTLTNKGLTATAKNVTTTLINLDTCASLINTATSQYGDIAHGESSTGIGSHFVCFHIDSPDSIYSCFRLDIASNGYTFWSDTFSVFIYPTSVREADGNHKIPTEFVLNQNYPNPFNSSTTIIYSIPEPGLATLKIYDLTGREIKILVNKFVEPGTHSVSFDASNLPSGMYIYKLQAGDLMEVRKMLLMR